MLEGAPVLPPLLKGRYNVYRTICIFFIIVYCLLFLAGCASLKRDYLAYQECKNNVTCWSKVDKLHNFATGVVTGVSASNPYTSPIASTVGILVGMFISIVGGVHYGKKIQRKKSANNVGG